MRALIIRSIPLGLQSNLALSVGVFVLTIGLFLAKLVVFEKGLPSGLGSVFGSEAIALGIGLFVCVALRFLSNSRLFLGRLVGGGAFLIAILASCLFCRSVGITAEAPTNFATTKFSGIGQLDWWPFSQPAAPTVFLVLFLIDFYGSIGKFIGLTAATNLRS